MKSLRYIYLLLNDVTIMYLGGLMILAGLLLQGYLGMQGTITLLEGTASERILVDDTYALHVEKRDAKDYKKIASHDYSIKNGILGGGVTSMKDPDSIFPDLDIQVMEYHPHSIEDFETWVKGGKGSIIGIPKIPALEWEDGALPTPTSLAWQLPFKEKWNIWALHTDAVTTALRQAFLHGATLLVKRRGDEVTMLSVPLEDALRDGVAMKNATLKLEFNINGEATGGFEKVELRFAYDGEWYHIPFFGKDKLFELAGPKKLPFHLDLRVKPTILVIEDSIGDNDLFAISPYGEVYGKHFHNGMPESFIVHDKGFGGYSVQVVLPFLHEPNDRENRFLAKMYMLTMEIRNAFKEASSVSPELLPIHRISDEEGLDFIEVWLRLLYTWLRDKGASLPPDLAKIISKLEDGERENLLQSYLPYMGGHLQEAVDALDEELDFIMQSYIVMKRFRASIDKIMVNKKLHTNKEKGDALAQLDIKSAEFLSAKKTLEEMFYAMKLSRVHITPKLISDVFLESAPIFIGDTSKEEMERLEDALQAPSYTVLEATLATRYHDTVYVGKPEEATPRISLLMRENGKEENVILGFDRHALGLKWPVLGGEYLVRFQPHSKIISYHIRLRDARQINYPDSDKAYNYESDVIIRDTRDGTEVATTISAKDVYETKDGYRFLLARIEPSTEVIAQRAYVIVNYDPIKYVLIYSGIVISIFGIAVFLWKKKTSPS